MPLDPEALYAQLGNLIAEMPDLAGPGPVTREMNQWLGRAAHLVRESGESVDAVGLDVASNFLASNRQMNAQQITAILYRALAAAEARAPAGARGAYVGPGEAFSAFQAVGKVLADAARELLIVDPYMSAKVLSDFVPAARESVRVHLLADSQHTKPDSLEPAAKRWAQQFGAARPLEIRLSPARALHDRLIFVDGASAVYSISQSLKDFAARSPASLLRIPPDIAQLKFDFYRALWASSAPV